MDMRVIEKGHNSCAKPRRAAECGRKENKMPPRTRRRDKKMNNKNTHRGKDGEKEEEDTKTGSEYASGDRKRVGGRENLLSVKVCK